jgi:hypothetical protein
MVCGHGNDAASLQAYSGGNFTPADIDKTKLSKNLQTVIFEDCYQGDYLMDWKTVLGNVNIVAWNDIVYTNQTISFNRLGWFDKQPGNLRGRLKSIVHQ